MAPVRTGLRAALRGAWNSDIAYSFRRSPLTIISAIITVAILLSAAFAPWIAPHNP